MSVRIDGLSALQRRLNAVKDTRPLLREVQIGAVAEAKARVPRKTGHLGRSIVPGTLTSSYAIVEARTNYAAFVELGTRPHVIEPRLAKALAFPASAGGRRLSGRARTGARMTFAKRVNHPGTKAQPYLVPGAKEALKRVGIESVVKGWNEAA